MGAGNPGVATAGLVLVGILIPVGFILTAMISTIETARSRREEEDAARATKVLRERFYQRMWFPWRDAVAETEPEGANAACFRRQAAAEEEERARRQRRREREEAGAEARRQGRHHALQGWTQPREEERKVQRVQARAASPNVTHYHGQHQEDEEEEQREDSTLEYQYLDARDWNPDAGSSHGSLSQNPQRGSSTRTNGSGRSLTNRAAAAAAAAEFKPRLPD